MAQSRLLKLKTDLKSLKFETGNEPYILFPIGYTKSFEKNDSIPQSITDFYLSNRTNADFPLRGGTVDVDPRTLTFTRSSQIDKERIKKFLEDKPKGPLFVLKQTGLQLSNPKIETGAIIPNLFSGLEFGGLGLENTRFYNKGVNTLAQVGVQGTGLHAVRHGALPFNPLQKMYAATVNEQNLNPTDSYNKNRLVVLKQIKLSKDPGTDTRTQAALLGVALGRQNLFQYFGGPDSVYGVGATTIRRYDDTELGTQTLAAGINASKYKKTVLRTYKEISELSSTVKQGGVQNYISIDRYGTGDPGNRDMWNGQDRMNLSPLLYFDSSKAPWEISENISYNKDIIKFAFEAIDNDNSQNATAVFFRAYLSAMSDNHTAAISAFKYLGRGEDFYTYQGASREISFSFKISPQSKEELAPLYKKLNFLISQVYPDYSPMNNIMRAPLMRLTIGDYFYRLPGLISNINISVEDTSPWEIRDKDEKVITSPEGPDESIPAAPIERVVARYRQLPHVINVQCSFKPIHDFLPERETYSVKTNKNGDGSTEVNTRVPFIVNDDTDFIKAHVVNSPEIDKQIENIKKRQEASVQNETSQQTSKREDASKPLKYMPPGKLFESRFERDIRTGNLFEFSKFQAERGVTGYNSM